jgi:hypothetical protein
VCDTDVVPLPHGQAPGVLAGGRLTGRWRYDRAAGRGIALCYDWGVSGPLAARRLDPHASGRFAGRWRYNRAAERGIALSYDGAVSGAPEPAPALPEPVTPVPTPVPTPAGRVRVLCSCGVLFTFENDVGVCPGCGRPAEWPTMGVVEREMRSDLEDLLRAHERETDPD